MTFKRGDKVRLPEWLGGSEGTFKDKGAPGRGQVAVGEATVFLPLCDLTKVLTEPIKVGSIHTDSSGCHYILSDYGVGNWFRFAGGKGDLRLKIWFTSN